MISIRISSLFLLNLCIIPLLIIICFEATAQKDKDEILRLRNASNISLKNFDDAHLNMLTDDVLITTGNGTLIQGKENLKTYMSKANGPKMYWVRTPTEIEVNSSLGLAWETGTWKGYTESGVNSVTGGKYSAHWSKIEGAWRIKSQLFVTLE